MKVTTTAVAAIRSSVHRRRVDAQWRAQRGRELTAAQQCGTTANENADDWVGEARSFVCSGTPPGYSDVSGLWMK